MTPYRTPAPMLRCLDCSHVLAWREAHLAASGEGVLCRSCDVREELAEAQRRIDAVALEPGGMSVALVVLTLGALLAMRVLMLVLLVP